MGPSIACAKCTSSKRLFTLGEQAGRCIFGHWGTVGLTRRDESSCFTTSSGRLRSLLVVGNVKTWLCDGWTTPQARGRPQLDGESTLGVSMKAIAAARPQLLTGLYALPGLISESPQRFFDSSHPLVVALDEETEVTIGLSSFQRASKRLLRTSRG